MHLRALWVFLLAAPVAASSCDKIPLFAPSESTITLSAPKRALQLDETVALTAVVLEASGTPVQNGTSVRFTTTLGSVSPVEVETRNGVATASFSAGTSSGTAEVRATSGAAGSASTGGTGGTGGTSTATNLLTFTIGGANAASLVASASPSTVPSAGGSTTITASLIDSLGNPVRGVQVTFSTDAGSLSSSAATTDTNGRAVVMLTTNRAAKVTARAGAGGTTALTAEVNVGVASSVSVALSTSPASPVAGQPVTLTVTGPTTTPFPSVTVNWGDGSTENIGLVSGARTVSHTYNNAGSFTILATATTEGESTVASTGVVVSPPASVTISASPTSGLVTQTFSFTVTPAATANPTNVRIDFDNGEEMDLGAITTATTVTKRYPANSTPRSYAVRATQANANGSSSQAVVVITITP